ncbi:MAG: tRNA 2-thiouridine(34) synthase MnmA [Actinomycetota bacterium]
MRLLAAMSGGVDSSVAAALARRAGHEVVGVTLKQWELDDEETRLTKGCCTLDAVADARRAADVIGIPHYTLDFREVFAREVVEPFVADYARGLTPNPCVRCNELVRFGALLDRAERLGFDGLVTGHYVRLERDDDGGIRLLRARDAQKDQSYVLYALDQPALRRAVFPLGAFGSKSEVRQIARSLDLPNADREDSVDVCFVGEGRKPGDVVAEHTPAAVSAGPIVMTTGEVIGEHKGLPYYTVGQRRGLGSLGGSRRYVTALDPSRNAVVVGDRDALVSHALDATRPRFVRGAPRDGDHVSAVVRYRGTQAPARFYGSEHGFRLEFERPPIGVAPGQAVVLYADDEVLGGGTITRRR